MPTLPPGDPNTLVERFMEARRNGQRLSIERLLDSSEIRVDRDAARAEVVRILGRRLRSGAVATSPGSSEPTGAAATSFAPPPELPGYEIIDLIGRGGMGVVWEAYHTPTGRRVAVKFLNESAAATDTARQRFEREVDLLARLQHPHIVSVLDSGVHSGRYFYAMDYVEGRPLDEAFVPGKADVRHVFEVLAVIAETVDFAHQRGVLHRDLKPGNILVVDESGIRNPESGVIRGATPPADSAIRNPQSAFPLVLDFGLAKAMDPGRTGSSGFEASLSEPGQLLGTLAYMPPEQSRGRLAEMSVRSDVYALGAIAYELLTGRLPVPIDGALGDVLQRIAQQNPPPPSGLRPGLSADIDAIVLKALQKSPDRRYATAADFAADIRRYLSDQPVFARPDTFTYRAGKFVRRNKLPVAFAATVFLAITTLAVTMTLQSRRIARERDLAEAARAQADRNQKETEKVAVFQSSMLRGISPAAMGTVLRRELHKQVRDALVARWVAADAGKLRKLTEPEIEAAIEQFDLSTSPANLGDVAREIIIATVLKPTQIAIEREFVGNLLVAGKLQETLGLIYCSLGLPATAELFLQKSLASRQQVYGDGHPDSATSLNNLAMCLKDQGRLQEATNLYRKSIMLTRSLQGDCEDLATATDNLGVALMESGDLVAAEASLNEALSLRRKLLGTQHADVARTLMNLGGLYFYKGEYDQAERFMLEALDLQRKLPGNDKLALAKSMENLSQVCLVKGDYEKGVALSREALDQHRRLLGNDHPDVAVCLNNLALFLKAQGNLAEAEAVVRQALALQRELLGRTHPDVANSLNDLAELLKTQGDLQAAEGLYRQAIDIWRGAYGPDHDSIAAGLNNLAMLQRELGKRDAAEATAREALAIRKKTLGSEHPYTAQSLSNVALMLRDKGDDTAAEPFLRDALRIYEKTLPAGHERTWNVRGGLGRVLLKQHRFSDAEPLLLETLRAMRASPGVAPHRVESTMNAIILLYDRWGAAEPSANHKQQADEWRAKLAAWQATTQPATTGPAASQPKPAPATASQLDPIPVRSR